MGNPQQAASFFAFLEYPCSAIETYLIEQHGFSEEEAKTTATSAVEQHRENEADDDRQEARNAAAVEAEHDLSTTTWR